MAVNHEGIYATRPWKIYGEGPSMLPQMERTGRLGFNERGRNDLTPEDIRFTVKGSVLHAFINGMAATAGRSEAGSCEQSAAAGHNPRRGHARSSRAIEWSQDDAGLNVDLPPEKPCDHAVVLKSRSPKQSAPASALGS
jgi:alpha-L-fucosidase